MASPKPRVAARRAPRPRRVVRDRAAYEQRDIAPRLFDSSSRPTALAGAGHLYPAGRCSGRAAGTVPALLAAARRRPGLRRCLDPNRRSTRTSSTACCRWKGLEVGEHFAVNELAYLGDGRDGLQLQLDPGARVLLMGGRNRSVRRSSCGGTRRPQQGARSPGRRRPGRRGMPASAGSTPGRAALERSADSLEDRRRVRSMCRRVPRRRPRMPVGDRCGPAVWRFAGSGKTFCTHRRSELAYRMHRTGSEPHAIRTPGPGQRPDTCRPAGPRPAATLGRPGLPCASHSISSSAWSVSEILVDDGDRLHRRLYLPGLVVEDEVVLKAPDSAHYCIKPSAEVAGGSPRHDHRGGRSPASLFVRFAYCTRYLQPLGDELPYDAFVKQAYIAMDVGDHRHHPRPVRRQRRQRS